MPLAGQGLKGTKLAGEYNKVQMFEDGNWLPVTVIKRAKEMWVEYTGVGKTLSCHFKNEDKPGIDEGRIGLRLMPGRLSSFRNFTVSLRPAGFLEPSTVPVTPVKSTPKRKSKKKAKQSKILTPGNGSQVKPASQASSVMSFNQTRKIMVRTGSMCMTGTEMVIRTS